MMSGDLCWYVEINLFWAAHQTHHSSEEYNLSTALRQSMLQQFTSWVCILIIDLNLIAILIIAILSSNCFVCTTIHISDPSTVESSVSVLDTYRGGQGYKWVWLILCCR